MRVAGPIETGCNEEDRFRIELEFVQCLGNPDYLHREPLSPAVTLRSDHVCYGNARAVSMPFQ